MLRSPGTIMGTERENTCRKDVNRHSEWYNITNKRRARWGVESGMGAEVGVKGKKPFGKKNVP